MIQVALGVGVIYGFSFLVPHVTPTVALFFATGAPTLSIILIGLTVVPQETAQSRTDGRQTYLAALPVPRLAPMLAEVSFWLLVTYMADVVRGSLSGRYDVNKGLAFGVVSAYCVVGLTLAARAASRRR